MPFVILTFKRRSLFLIVGWSVFGFLAYKAAAMKTENKVYNPFEILEISTVSEISLFLQSSLYLLLGHEYKRHQVTL
jgi:translocation protein SEC63